MISREMNRRAIGAPWNVGRVYDQSNCYNMIKYETTNFNGRANVQPMEEVAELEMDWDFGEAMKDEEEEEDEFVLLDDDEVTEDREDDDEVVEEARTGRFEDWSI